MTKKKPKFDCDKCPRSFDSSKALSIHKSRAGHWFTPTPTPQRDHVNYFDLVRNSFRSWGQEMTKEERKHPAREQLLLGAAFVIADTLIQILEEVKKERTIK